MLEDLFFILFIYTRTEILKLSDWLKLLGP